MTMTFQDEGTAARYFKGTSIPANLAAITATQWAAGTDIAGALVVGSSTFQFTDPDTIDEKSYKDKGKSQIPTTDNYEGNATMRRDRTATGTLSATDPTKIFVPREEGYIALRPGVPEDTAVAIGQDYVYFKYMVSKVNPLTAPNGETEKVEIGFLQRGDAGFGVIAA
jgi:hypothetical protein